MSTLNTFRRIKALAAPALLLVISLALCGCPKVFDQKEPLTQVQLKMPPPPQVCSVTVKKQLIVSLPESGGDLKTDRIALLFNEREVRYLSDVKWNSQSAYMIQRMLIRQLEQSCALSGVGTEASGIAASLRLQCDLERLYLCYPYPYSDGDGPRPGDSGTPPEAQIRLRLQLMDLDTGKVIGSKIVDARVPAKGNSTSQLLDALDEAAAQTLTQSLDWVTDSVGAKK